MVVEKTLATGARHRAVKKLRPVLVEGGGVPQRVSTGNPEVKCKTVTLLSGAIGLQTENRLLLMTACYSHQSERTVGSRHRSEVTYFSRGFGGYLRT
jgi:hypothetical protein